MLKRSHLAGTLRPEHAGQDVTVCGWINTFRDQGKGLIFCDVRDRTGLVQAVFDVAQVPPEVVTAAKAMRREDVVAIRGSVRRRAGEPNPKLATGEVEILAAEVEILNKTETPPILPDEHEAGKIAEEIRLKHRYIDLRRPRMQSILATRSRITKLARDYFAGNGFLEIETPLLIRSTPEGARDFVVPSRLHPGSWYALPQSPQLFKQILMVAGCDRYLQICKCLRDEDPRADRQAEFTQIDLEMSFVEREDVIAMMSGFARALWKELFGVDIAPGGSIPRMTYAEAMDRYGIDRPDTRFGLEIVDVSDLAAKTTFGVFKDAIEKVHLGKPGCVKAIRVPGGAEKLTRKMTDAYSEWVKTFKAGGVPTVKLTANGLETGIAKFLEPVKDELISRLGLEPGDAVLFAADRRDIATKAMGELRLRLGRELGLIPEGKWNFLWVVDFPMFEWDEEGRRWVALHHPFTSPNPDQFGILDSDPGACLSAGYDLVLNGSEIGGGSIRIHRPEIQKKVFSLIGLTDEDAKVKFGFLLDALRYGAPPHGGIAFGLDRLVMHAVGTDNIRDVIAFPKTQSGADLMTEAPGPVDASQLEELRVRSVPVEAAKA
jgi:aspartyl-tRNA synthetase